MAKYKSRPVEVEAWRLEDGALMPEWIGKALLDDQLWRTGRGGAVVVTPHGRTTASLGDWIVKDADGHLYPVKNSIFVQRWEEC